MSFLRRKIGLVYDIHDVSLPDPNFCLNFTKQGVKILIGGHPRAVIFTLTVANKNTLCAKLQAFLS